MNKELNRIDVLALVIGSIIGWGSFTLPGTKFLPESGVINTAIGLALGGLSVLFIQKGYHLMLENHVEDGGEFSYAYRQMGPGYGFIVGWSLLLCYLSLIPLNATAFVLVLKILFGSKVEYLYLYEIAGYPVFLSDILIACAIMILFAAINIKGLRVSSRVQNVMVLFLVANVFLLLMAMLFVTDKTVFIDHYVNQYQLNWSQIAKVVAITPFLFVGFDVIPQVSTTLNFKPAKATRLAVISIITGVLIYAILNFMAGLVFSPEEAPNQDWALGSAILGELGIIGFILLIIALAAAVTGGINGFMISSSRLLSSVSSYGLAHAKYKEKNQKDVYVNSIKFVTLISLIAPWFGREVIIYIVDMCSLLAAVAYFYVCYIGFRKSVEILDKVLSLIGTFVSLTFMGLLLIPASPGHLSTPSIIFMFIWGICGFVYFRIYKKKKSKAR